MKKLKINNNVKTLVLTLSVGLLLGYLITSSGVLPDFKNVSAAKAQAKTEAYLASLPLDSYTVESVTKTDGIYTLELTVNEYPYTSYMSLDGKFLFQGGIDLTQEQPDAAADGQPAPTEISKSDKPNVELFVMSHCPYGTQIEKGILPVVDTLGEKIDFEIKFVDYAMHGKTEVDEQLNQYCIQKEMGKETYLSYLTCFLESGKGDECIASTGINKAALTSCTTQADAEFSITANYDDKSTWNGQYPPFNTSKEDNVKYGVAGSPTLIINGTEAQASRDSASLLATVCSAFTEQPEECTIQLSSETPSTGFGSGTTTGGSAEAQCN